jgi:hypothetical protein
MLVPLPEGRDALSVGRALQKTVGTLPGSCAAA